MSDTGLTVRKVVAGLALAGAAAAGMAACSSSTKTRQPSPPAGQNLQAPVSTTVPSAPSTTVPSAPPTTKAPSSGGASF